MPKAFCVITTAQAVSASQFTVGYSCATDVPVRNFSSDFKPNTALSIAQNLADLKTKVVTDCAGQGVTIATTDVIVFGGPG